MKTKIINVTPNQTNPKLVQKKQQVVEKIGMLFKKKFERLFKEKGYLTKMLYADLVLWITDKDLSSFDFPSQIIRLEKLILDKLTKIQPKVNEGKGLDMNKIKDLIEIQTEKHKENHNETPNQIQNPQTSDSNTTHPTQSLSPRLEKTSKLLEKQEDEWARIAKYDYEKHLMEEKMKKDKVQEKKKLQKEFLEKQMEEKRQMKHKLDLEEKNFQIKSKENLEKLNEMDKLKLVEMQTKINNQKLMQQRMMSESQKLKEENHKKELSEDLTRLGKIQKEIATQEKDLQDKKIKERETYKKLMEENDMRINLQKLEKKQMKEKSKSELEEYTKLIEKQEQERVNSRKNKYIEVINKADRTFDKNKNKEKEFRLYEEQKILKEIKEKEEK